jgi:hypothetical protein
MDEIIKEKEIREGLYDINLPKLTEEEMNEILQISEQDIEESIKYEKPD